MKFWHLRSILDNPDGLQPISPTVRDMTLGTTNKDTTNGQVTKRPCERPYSSPFGSQYSLALLDRIKSPDRITRNVAGKYYLQRGVM
jgi:hypothetical protein